MVEEEDGLATGKGYLEVEEGDVSQGEGDVADEEG